MCSALRRFVLCACILLQSVLLLRAMESPSQMCAYTKDAMEKKGFTDSTNLIHTSPKANSGSMCQLNKTCCSLKGESVLQEKTVETYVKEISSTLGLGLAKNHNEIIFDDLVTFFDKTKNMFVNDLLLVFGVYFQGYEDIFDELFDYLKTATRTGETAALPQVFHQMFFEVYLATYLAVPSTVPLSNSPQIRDCFYKHFMDNVGDLLESWLIGFQRAFIKTMHYLRALRAANLVIKNTQKIVMTEQCKLSLMKMDDCALCAGYQAISSCNGLCLNILRGCLLDLSDLVEPITSFSQVLVAMKEHISEFSIFQQTHNLETNVFAMIDLTTVNAAAISISVTNRCINLRGKRSGDIRNQRTVAATSRPNLSPRSTETYPLDSLNNSAYILQDSVRTLSNLPDNLCHASQSDKLCWNGRSYGSYSRKVMDFGRTSQANNPEILICPKETSQFIFEVNLLRQLTTELASISGTCSTDDEDCREVKSITKYYDFSSVSSTVLLASEEEEGSGSGFGSGSGSGSMDDLCISKPENIETEEEETREISGSRPAHSRNALLLLSIAMTVVLLASWL